MCCRLRADGIDQRALAHMVEMGNMEMVNAGQRWKRNVDDGMVIVQIYEALDVVEFQLSPSVVKMEDHHGKRNMAGAMFELAARYAESIGTTARQIAINVPECMEEGTHDHLIADYPRMRMNFELVCPGFRGVFTSPLES